MSLKTAEIDSDEIDGLGEGIRFRVIGPGRGRYDSEA